MPDTMLDALLHWSPSQNLARISTIDAHTAGEPLRILIDGVPQPTGKTMLEKRRDAQRRWDHLRTALMWEPRGHADMYGCLITPPVTSDADFGVLFLHNEGFSTMCGHGIIAVTTVLLETGAFPARTTSQEEPITLRIDTPAGLVTASARLHGQRVASVSFQNVPSFVVALDQTVTVPGLGEVRYDLAFGGAFYAYVDADAHGLDTSDDAAQTLIEAGKAIKRAVMETRTIAHPFQEDLGFLYGTLFTSKPHQAENHSRHVCIFAEGELDRCPTGTGVSGRMAILHARGEIDLSASCRIESILGTCFGGRVIEETTCGPYAAVIPEVTGSAHITGRHEFLLDPNDPLQHGFFLR